MCSFSPTLRLMGALLAIAAPSGVATAQVSLDRFRACLSIEDMTKERLDCFDALVRPEPKVVTARPKVIADCRFLKEQDERLRCYNGFLTARPAAKPPAAVPSAPQIPLARFRECLSIEDMTKERLDCFDAIVRPDPQPVTAKPTSIMRCKIYLEQDARLRCYNSFLVVTVRLSKPAVPATVPAPKVRATTTHVRKGRGGCGSRGGAGYRLPSGKCASRKR